MADLKNVLSGWFQCIFISLWNGISATDPYYSPLYTVIDTCRYHEAYSYSAHCSQRGTTWKKSKRASQIKVMSKQNCRTHVKNGYQILTLVKNWYQIITHMKNWYLTVTDVSDKTVKNWNRKQNAADLVVFYQCEGYACMLYKIWFRAHFSQSVRYL